MDAQLKAKWVEALRSGEYKQAKDSLRKGGGFCCLGVLSDISCAGSWREDDEWAGAWVYEIDGKTASQYLPQPVAKIAGLSGDDVSPLMDMNDAGTPFPEIADYIEQKL